MVTVGDRDRVKGVVPAKTGPIGVAKHRIYGVLSYDAVHLARDLLTHYSIFNTDMTMYLYSEFERYSGVGSSLQYSGQG